MHYSEQIADQICERLIEGESLRTICASEGFPSRASVLRWMDADKEFEAKCARARAMQADLMDDLILDVAAACNEDNCQSSKVKLSAYQWRASKLAPKKYGDKIEHSGQINLGLAAELAEARKRKLGGGSLEIEAGGE